MQKFLLLAMVSLMAVSPNVFAQNLLKDAVRLNRDIKDTKSNYRDDSRQTERKLKRAKEDAKELVDGCYGKKHLAKVERKASKKIEKVKDRLDPRDEIADKVHRDIKIEKRKAINNWLAE